MSRHGTDGNGRTAAHTAVRAATVRMPTNGHTDGRRQRAVTGAGGGAGCGAERHTAVWQEVVVHSCVSRERAHPHTISVLSVTLPRLPRKRVRRCARRQLHMQRKDNDAGQVSRVTLHVLTEAGNLTARLLLSERAEHDSGFVAITMDAAAFCTCDTTPCCRGSF